MDEQTEQRQHCGQPMRYDAIEGGDVFDGQKLTGIFYCERCSVMNPTYTPRRVAGTCVKHCGWCDADYDFHAQSIHCPNLPKNSDSGKVGTTPLADVEEHQNSVSDAGLGHSQIVIQKDNTLDADQPLPEFALADLKLWFRRVLDDPKRLKYRSTTRSDSPVGEGYSYVEIPEWEFRQKQDLITEAINGVNALLATRASDSSKVQPYGELTLEEEVVWRREREQSMLASMKAQGEWIERLQADSSKEYVRGLSDAEDAAKSHTCQLGAPCRDDIVDSIRALISQEKSNEV